MIAKNQLQLIVSSRNFKECSPESSTNACVFCKHCDVINDEFKFKCTYRDKHLQNRTYKVSLKVFPYSICDEFKDDR